MGEPTEIDVKLTGIQPVPSTFLYVEVDLQEYVWPEGNAGRPRFAHVGDVSGIEIYVVEAVPREGLLTSASYMDRALLIVARSEIRLLSLAARSNSAGFMVRTTTTARIATIPMTTRSSMRVKPWLFIYFYNFELDVGYAVPAVIV